MILTVAKTDLRATAISAMRVLARVLARVHVHVCAGMARTVSGQREKVEEVWRLFSDIHGRPKRILKNCRGG